MSKQKNPVRNHPSYTTTLKIAKPRIDIDLFNSIVSVPSIIFIGNDTPVKKVFSRKQFSFMGAMMDQKDDKLTWDEFNELFHLTSSSSKTSNNYGLQWFEATYGAAVLGYGECSVNGVKYGAKADGKSPPDCLRGPCNGNNSLTKKSMEYFFGEIQSVNDPIEIAQKWVEAGIQRYDVGYIESQKNALGIGATSIGNGEIQVKLYAYNPITGNVQCVWSAVRNSF